MVLLQTSINVNDTLKAPQAVVEATRDLLNGDPSTLDNVLQQCVKLAVEGGKCIIVALLIYIVGHFIIKIIKKLLNGVMDRHKMDPTIQSFLRSLVNILLNVLLIITVVSALGINTTSFAALLASIGVAAGMALSGNLQNLAGGIIVLFFKPFRVGDYIEAQGVSGTVKEIQIFHTIILTTDNKQIHIPNGTLSSGTITNYSTCPQRRVDLTICTEYDEDPEKVRDTILQTVSTDERILQDPAPFIGIIELAESSVNYTVRLWVKGTDYWPVFFDIQERIYQEFRRQNIPFPYPHITINKA